MKNDIILEQKFIESYEAWELVYSHYKKYIEAGDIEADEFSVFSQILFCNIIATVEDFFLLPEHMINYHEDKILNISESAFLLRENILFYADKTDTFSKILKLKN